MFFVLFYLVRSNHRASMRNVAFIMFIEALWHDIRLIGALPIDEMIPLRTNPPFNSHTLHCPALRQTIHADSAKDIIDEAIEFFRANVLFRTFQPKSGADLLLCYLTVYISELISFLYKSPENLAECRKKVQQVSYNSSFKIPGNDGFCLSGFMKAPQTPAEAEQLRSYLLHLRQECANRLVEILFRDNKANKWWFGFRTRKFMNIDRT